MMMLWRTWWLQPLWALVVVPLGVPPLSFWMFAALMVFVAACRSHAEVPKKVPESEKSGAAEYLSWGLADVIGPPLVFVYVSWMVSQ